MTNQQDRAGRRPTAQRHRACPPPGPGGLDARVAEAAHVATRQEHDLTSRNGADQPGTEAQADQPGGAHPPPSMGDRPATTGIRLRRAGSSWEANFPSRQLGPWSAAR
jgi:hypothetical protein